MIKIKQLKKNNEDFYPVVPIESVVFPDGSNLSDKDLVVEGDLQNFYNKSEADSKFVTNPEHDADVTRLEDAIEDLSDRINNIKPGGIESETDPVFSASPAARISNNDIQNWNSKSSTTGTVTGVKVNGVNATVTNGIAEVNIPVNNVDENTIAGYGFTKNQGTITGITMNGISKGVSGNIDLGTVITEHQNVSGKENTSNKVTSISSSSTNNQYPSAKAVYDKIGDLSQLSTSAKGNLVSAINEAANSSSFSGNYNDLTGKPTIPTQLSQLSEDNTHQTVTAAEKESWNASSGFSGDYEELRNKPTIPTEQTVAGWGFAKTANIIESDPTVPSYVKNISQNDIANWNSKTSNVGTLTGVTFNGSPAQVVNGVAQVVAATGTGGDENIIESISINNVTQAVSNKNVNITVPTTLADLPTDSTHQTVTATEKSTWNAKSSFSGNYNDLQGKPSTVNYTEQSLTNEQKAQARQNIGAGTSNFGGTYNELTGTPTIPTALADLTDDSTHRFVTDTEKSTWNAKYDKPAGGIPATDLASNVLSDYATKTFVNSSIASSTGNLITNNGDSWPSLSALQGYSGTVAINDYAFVSTTDGLGNTIYSRYKYGSTGWVKEYDLNNSSFTQAQWDTINSGITSTKVSNYDSHVADTTIHVTTADKNAWNAKSNFSGNYNDLTNKPTIPAAQVNSDWNANSGVAQILNKPTIPDVSGLASSVSVNGNTYNASNGTVTLPDYPTSLPASDVQAWAKSATKPTYTASEVGALPINTPIPTGPVQSDWNVNDPSSLAYVKNKPNLTTYFEPGTGEGSLVRKNQNNLASGVGSLALGINTTASGLYSVAEGENTISAGYASHTEGLNTYADNYSHAEGESTKALAYNSHAEGLNSVANGYASHAQGSSVSCGEYSHSEGGSSYDTWVNINGSISKTVNGNYSTLTFETNNPIPNEANAVIINNGVYEIYDISYVATNTYDMIVYGNPDVTYCDNLKFSYSTAFGSASHAEGWSLAKGNNSHSEGLITFANGTGSHAEGSQTVAEGNISHAEGIRSFAGGYASHAEGSSAAIGGLSHSEGGSEYGYFADVTSLSVSAVSNGRCTITYTLDPNSSIPNDAKAVAINDQLFFIIGYTNNALIIETNYRPDITGCHTLYFYNSVAKGDYSHSEGTSLAYGNISHAEGNSTVSNGLYSHAEGSYTNAAADSAHAEGCGTYANSQYSHAEGSATSATGIGSHAEGTSTFTYDAAAHAEGDYTQATGYASHAEGSQTRAINMYEHAQGRYNVSHTPNVAGYSFGYGLATIHSIGIGNSDVNRKNAVEVMDDGSVYVKGIGSYDGTNPNQADTLQYVINNTTSSGTDVNAMHLTGTETAAGVKTFSDGIVVEDPSYISFGNISVANNGFTYNYITKQNTTAGSSISFETNSEPKAFVLAKILSSGTNLGSNVVSLLSLVGDSTTIGGVYTNGTQHNYSTAFTTTYANGTFTISSSISNIFSSGDYELHAYYGDGSLTFRQSIIQPTSGQTTAAFSNLVDLPTMFAIQLESQVNSESYHRVGSVVGWFNSDGTLRNSWGLTFYSNNVYPYYNGSNNFTISYSNNTLTINSGGQNNGGYFHNPGTYKLYYLVASDVEAGSSNSNSTLQDELDAKYEKPSSGIPASDLASDVRTALSNANNAIQTETDPVFLASAAATINSERISYWNNKQEALVSGSNIKTINGQSILGNGDLPISGGTGGNGTNGTDGQSAYKSTIFVRMNGTPTKPPASSGSYSSPHPADIAGNNAKNQSVSWSDGIPPGDETLWASTRLFVSGTGSLQQDAQWSDPKQMTDTETYNVEFAPLLPNDVKPSDPTYGTNGTINNRGTGNNRNDGLYNSFTTARNNNIVWFDPDLDANITGIDFTQMAWRAEQSVVNGVGGNWTILRIKGESGAPGNNGDPAIYLDLTNEHDSFLYDNNGNLLTNPISTTATLYRSGIALTGVTYGINGISGCTSNDVTVSASTGLVTVIGASDSGYVLISATYNGLSYVAKFTFTRIVGLAKYDLEVDPTAIAYNTSTQLASQSTINVKIYCTHQGINGMQRDLLSSLDSRFTLKVDGNSIANNSYSSTGYTFNVDPTRSYHTISLIESGVLWDIETVPIGKYADGTNGSDPGQSTSGSNGYSTAIVKLYKDYQRGSNDPEIPTVSWPNGANTTTYTFATDTLTNAPSGWSRIIPANPLGVVYVIAATFYSNTATDTVNINEWSTPVPNEGVYFDTVRLYYRTCSAGGPASGPTGNVTYNFVTGQFSGQLGSWSGTIPTHNGCACWTTQATVMCSNSSVTINSSKWSRPQKLVEDGADGADGQSALIISSPQWEFIYPATNEGNLTNPIVPVNNQFTLFYGTSEKAVDKWYLSTRVCNTIDYYAEDPNDPTSQINIKETPIYYVGTDLSLVNKFANDSELDYTGYYYLWINSAGTKYYSNSLNLVGPEEPGIYLDSVYNIDGDPIDVGTYATILPITGLSMSNTGLLYSNQSFGFTEDVVNVPIFAETTIDGEKVVTSEMVHFVKQKAGAQGERGFAGKIMRGISAYTNQPEVPYQGLNDTDPTKIYYDVVTHNSVLYYCKVSEYNNNAAASYEPNVSTGWQNVWQVATNFKFVATDLLLANNAHIDFVGTQGIYLKNGNDVVGGGQAGNGTIWWAGSTSSSPNPSTAPFRVNYDGSVVATNGTFKGTIQADDGYFNGKLMLPFVNMTSDKTLASTDSSSIIIKRANASSAQTYATGYTLTLPNNAIFDGWMLNVYVEPRYNRNDGNGKFAGKILVPDKAEESRLQYYASVINALGGGFFNFICVSGQWVLTNYTAGMTTFTQWTE